MGWVGGSLLQSFFVHSFIHVCCVCFISVCFLTLLLMMSMEDCVRDCGIFITCIIIVV